MKDCNGTITDMFPPQKIVVLLNLSRILCLMTNTKRLSLRSISNQAVAEHSRRNIFKINQLIAQSYDLLLTDYHISCFYLCTDIFVRIHLTSHSIKENTQFTD